MSFGRMITDSRSDRNKPEVLTLKAENERLERKLQDCVANLTQYKQLYETNLQSHYELKRSYEEVRAEINHLRRKVRELLELPM